MLSIIANYWMVGDQSDVWGAGPRLQNPVMHLANSLEALVNSQAQRGISDLPLLLGCMWSGRLSPPTRCEWGGASQEALPLIGDSPTYI